MGQKLSMTQYVFRSLLMMMFLALNIYANTPPQLSTSGLGVIPSSWESIVQTAGEMKVSKLDSTNTPYIAYLQYVDNENNKLIVEKYNGTSWEVIGDSTLPTNKINYLSLAFDSTDKLYVAYDGNAINANVIKFDGTDWVAVGNENFSDDSASDISLAIDSNDIPYVTYSDNYEYQRITVMKLNGDTWGSVGAPRFSTGSVFHTQLVLDSTNTPYVAYVDGENDTKATVKKFNGTTWENVGSGEVSSGSADHISFALDSTNTPYISYQDASDSYKVTVKKFNGTTWEVVGGSAVSDGFGSYTSLAFDKNNILYLAYNDNDWSIGSVVMKFNGTTWDQIGGSSFGGSNAKNISLTFDSNNILYVVSANSTPERSVKKLLPDTYSINTPENQIIVRDLNATDIDNDTVTFSVSGVDGNLFDINPTTGVLSFKTAPDFENPTDTGADNTYDIVVSVNDSQGGENNIFLAVNVTNVNLGISGITKSGGEWTNFGDTNSNPSMYQGIKLALDSNGTPYIAYPDASNANKATVMKYNGTTWDVVGSAGFTTSSTYQMTLSLDGDGTSYIAYPDTSNSDKAMVMKYNGTTWDVIGDTNSNVMSQTKVTLVLDSNGVPYIAYSDASNTNQATVKKYNGTTWDVVGSAGFSGGETANVSLVFNSSNTPYVAYRDGSDSNKSTVMKYIDNTWEVVGTTGFSTGTVSDISLVFDKNSSTPYVAFVEDSNNNQVTVMKFNGNTWEIVGAGGFGNDTFYKYLPTLTLDNNGNPYVTYIAFIDMQNNIFKAIVMKLSGNSWEAVENLGFTGDKAILGTLAFDKNNVGYIAYSDDTNKAIVMQLEPELNYVNIPENQTNVADINPIDANTPTFSISGVDASLFNIDSSTGVLSFKIAPDYEVPSDDGVDNSYDIVVTINDGQGGIKNTALQVNVTNVDPELSIPTFSGGDGTSGNPYQISTLNDLKALSEDSRVWDKYFVQTTDINATDTKNWNNGAGFSPIGDATTAFTGEYYGGGDDYNYTAITNLYINRPTENNIGFFGSVGTMMGSLYKIHHFQLLDVNITGKDNVGAMAGYSPGVSIYNAYVSGHVQGGTSVGGFVGSQFYGSLESVHSDVDVVATGDFVGGLAGRSGSAGRTQFSSSRGDVQGADYVGGLIGYAAGYAEDCFSSGQISATGTNKGGLIAFGGANSETSFWDINTSGVTTSAGGDGVVGKTTAQMQDYETYSEAYWSIIRKAGLSKDYPIHYGDSFAIKFPNNAPTDISISCVENNNLECDNGYNAMDIELLNTTAQNSIIATFSVEDSDLENGNFTESHTFGFCSSGVYNNLFVFDGADLKLNSSLANMPSSYIELCVRVTDADGAFYDEDLSVYPYSNIDDEETNNEEDNNNETPPSSTTPEITTTTITGSKKGSTSISATPASGNTLAYKIVSTTITTPTVGDSIDGTTPYTSGNDIEDITSGKYIALYELDSDGKVVSFKLVPVTSNDIAVIDIAQKDISDVYEWLIFDVIKNQNAKSTFVDNDLNLVSTDSLGKNTTITWSSSNEDVINPSTSSVTLTDSKKYISLTATITKDSYTIKKTILVTVPQNGLDDSGKVALDKEGLTFEKIKLKNKISTEIYSDLNLTTSGDGGSTISWSSSDTNVITNIGTVTKQNSDTNVTLTATITSNAVTDTKDLNVTVKADIADATEAILDAKNKLTVKEFLKDNRSPFEVFTDLNLITSWINDTAISWEIDNTDVVNTDGTVTRGGEDKKVKLTVTISKNGTTDTKEFYIVVKSQEKESIAQKTKVENVTFKDVNEDNSGSDTKVIKTTFNNGSTDINSSISIDKDLPSSVSVTENGVSVNVEIPISKNSKLKTATVFQNSNGTTENQVEIEDSNGNTNSINISSLPTKSDTSFGDDGSLEVNATVGTVVSNAKANADGSLEHIVINNNKETKATSYITDTSIAISEDGNVTTTSQKDGVIIKVIGRNDGKAQHTVTVGTTISKATSNITGAQTVISINGNVTTSADTGTQKNSRKFEAVAITDASGETITKFREIDGSDVEYNPAPTLKNGETFPIGSDVNITEDSGVIHIQTTTPTLETDTQFTID